MVREIGTGQTALEEIIINNKIVTRKSDVSNKFNQEKLFYDEKYNKKQMPDPIKRVLIIGDD